MFTKCFFSAPKVLFVCEIGAFLLKMCFFSLGRVLFFKCFFSPKSTTMPAVPIDVSIVKCDGNSSNFA